MSVQDKRDFSMEQQNAPEGPLRIAVGSTDYLGNVLTTALFEYFLKPEDTAVEVTNASTDHYTIRLPNVDVAKGKIYTIRAVESAAGNVLVDEQDDSIDNDNLPATLGTTLDYIVLYCDGMKWYTLDSEHD